MNLFKLAAQIFLIYLLYKVITEFIIPLYKSTKKFKSQFSEMQSKMNEQMNRGHQPQQQAPPQPEVNTTVTKEGDYIEFEEIDPKV